MSTNDPISRHEVELRLETVEERIDHKLDLILFEVKNRFGILEKDIDWLSKLVMGVLFLLLGILVTGAIKWMFH